MYVSRDLNNNITGAYANPQSFATEFVADTDATLIAFLNPPTPIKDITHRQFYQQMAMSGIITPAQALAMVQTGTIPPPLQTIVNAMPTSSQFPALMMLYATESISRNHPMTIAIGTAYGFTSAQMDAFFQAAVNL